MNQNCFICNLPIGISARNCVNIFKDHSGLQSGKKLHEVISDVVETTVAETPGQSSVVCKKCQKACTEFDTLKTKLQLIKTELQDSYKKTLLLRNSKTNEPPKVTKETKKIVLPASKLQPLPANYVIGMGGWKTNMFPKIESMRTLNTGAFKLANNFKLAISNATTTQIASSISTSPIKVTTADLVTSPSKITDTSISDKIVTSLMLPSLTQSSIVTKKTKNPVMSFNVNLPKDFLASAVMTKSDDGKESELVKKQEGIGDLVDDVEKNDEQPMEIDEDCSLAVVPVTTDENGKLVFEVDSRSLDLKPKTNSNFFDVGLLLEEDGETRTSERDEKFILDKLHILNENLDDEDDDEQTIVMENGATIIRMGSSQQVVYSPTHYEQDTQDSNDESQIELQVSGDEETANAIIAAAQEQGGAFIKVESGEMYRVKSVQSKTEEEVETTMHLSNIVEAQEEGTFKCLLCEKNKDNEDSFTSCVGDAEYIMVHLKASHSARLYICQVCGRVMRRRSEYAAHIEDHAKKNKNIIINKSKLHSCLVCTKTYNSRTLLSEHMNTHTGSRPYACAACHKGFASKYTLQAHLKTHEERPRPFKCASCGKAFLTQQNLAQHEKTHSGVKEFVCKVCNKAFATQHNLEVHCVVHTGRKPFFCSVCNKGFARRAEVKDHMRIHTGERPFTCDICGATFTQRSNLHSHKRATHFDDKRYHCAHCPKRFKRRRLLDYHIQAVHTGERPLKCEICRATFVYPEHYKKHVRIHSGERPYVCEVCGKTFNSRDNRNMHRFVHSDKKPYECLACGAGYMRKQLLYNHMNTTGHVAESIVVNQPKVITAVQNGITTPLVDVHGVEIRMANLTDAIFETTSELELDENEANTVEDDETTKVFITEAGNKKIVLQDKSEINVLQDSEDYAFLTLHDSIETNGEDKLGEEAQIVTTDEKGNTMRLIQVQLPDGKSGWVAINN